MKRLLVCLDLTTAHDRFAVLACDGLYDVMSNNGIVSFISEEAEKPDATLDQISQARSLIFMFSISGANPRYPSRFILLTAFTHTCRDNRPLSSVPSTIF